MKTSPITPRPDLRSPATPNVPYLVANIPDAPGVAAVASLKRTRWIAGSKAPVRSGWYERDYKASLIKNPRDAGLRFDYFEVVSDKRSELFPGVWYTYSATDGLADAYYTGLPWRGVMRHRDALLAHKEADHF